jgi:hypothetical protein
MSQPETSDESHLPDADQTPQPLNYASANPPAQPAAAWVAVILGVLSLVPFSFWILVETGVVDELKLWFNARDHLMFFGTMGLGPVLGAAALLLAGPPKRHPGPTRRIRNIARACAGASLILGTGMSLIACAFAWPFVILNVLLIVGMRIAWYRL